MTLEQLRAVLGALENAHISGHLAEDFVKGKDFLKKLYETEQKKLTDLINKAKSEAINITTK